MRKGTNPAKLKDNKVENRCFHQVIVPVYLPKLEGYYAEGLDILKLCLESIYLTSHNRTYISVVNNGSCEKVKNYLNELLESEKIQEVVHTSAIGKINAIAKGLAGHNFDLVTITDADVLFTNGWQKAVYDIYETFPKAGMICTTPQSKRLRYLTETIFFDCLFSSKLKFRAVKNPDAMQKFAESIQNNKLLNKINLNKILTIKQEDITAVVGAGHFSATYKRSLLNGFNQSYSTDKISSKTDRINIDLPSIKKGHWRLSTYDNYSYHMGNSIQPWMNNFILKKESKKFKQPNYIGSEKYSFTSLKRFTVGKMIFSKPFWKYWLIYLGLSKNEARNY
jgi:hypothetical protein